MRRIVLATLAALALSGPALAGQYDSIYTEEADAEMEAASKEAITETAVSMLAEHCGVVNERQLYRLLDRASGDLLHFWQARLSYAGWNRLPMPPFPKYVKKDALWSAGMDMYANFNKDCAVFSDRQLVYQLLLHAGPA